MKILVSGASGFLGNHVINSLLAQGADVVATAVEAPDQIEDKSWFERVPYVRYDLSERDPDIFDLLHRPDTLIHLAWGGLPNYKDLLHFERNLFPSYFFIKDLR